MASAPQSGQAAVLFDPRLDAAALAEAAAAGGARIIRFGALPGSMVVELDPQGGPAQLRAAGAWLIADPIILGGCAAPDIRQGGLEP